MTRPLSAAHTFSKMPSLCVRVCVIIKYICGCVYVSVSECVWQASQVLKMAQNLCLGPLKTAHDVCACVWVRVCLCLPLSDINYTLETLRTCDLEDGNNNDGVGFGIGKRFIHISIAFHFIRLTANTTNPLYIREHAAAVHHQGAQRRFGTEFEPRPLGPISVGQRSAGGVERPSGRYLHWRHTAAAQRHRRPWHADQRAGHKTA